MTKSTKAIDDSYNPGFLFDALRKKMGLRSDAALARALEVNPSLLAKVRHGHERLSSALLLRIHEVTGTSIRDLQSLIGERRAKHRIGIARLARLGTASFRLEIRSPAPATPLKSGRHLLH
jgi:transcriptional regulator with XRE-family HTH domain